MYYSKNKARNLENRYNLHKEAWLIDEVIIIPYMILANYFQVCDTSHKHKHHRRLEDLRRD